MVMVTGCTTEDTGKKTTIWSLDTETTTSVDYSIDGSVRIYLWVAKRLGADDWEWGEDCDSLIEFMHRKDVKTVWVYNLKFDASFILDRLMREFGWVYTDGRPQGRTTRDVDMLVTDMGAWMSMTMRYGDHVVTMKDTAKKFPGFSLEEVARIYGIEGKSHLDVIKRRPPEYRPTEEDLTRCEGDVRILDHAMHDLYMRRMDRLTMASDAKAYFKEMWIREHPRNWKSLWEDVFAELTLEEDEWLREAYRGGWCYVNPMWCGESLEFHDLEHAVYVYDVNSLYPSRMMLELPMGRPIRCGGKPIRGMLYVVRFETCFELKEGGLPFLQERHDVRFTGVSEFITSSEGLMMTLTLTNVDYELFHEMYDVKVETRHEYWCFESVSGRDVFGSYIDHWMKEKADATIRKKNGDPGAEADRATAKRFMNAIYGKLSESPRKRRKIPRFVNDEIVWDEVEEEGKGWYLPMGLFITAYGRALTIRTAARFGDRFLYSDTDSVHVLGSTEPEGVEIDDVKLGAWKKESACLRARYVGPKKYIHQFVVEFKGSRPVIKCLSEVACAGMPGGCKAHVHWWDFKLGTEYPGKLSHCFVRGGTLLRETTFTIKDR